eukprot:52709_1
MDVQKLIRESKEAERRELEKKKKESMHMNKDDDFFSNLQRFGAEEQEVMEKDIILKMDNNEDPVHIMSSPSAQPTQEDSDSSSDHSDHFDHSTDEVDEYSSINKPIIIHNIDINQSEDSGLKTQILNLWRARSKSKSKSIMSNDNKFKNKQKEKDKKGVNKQQQLT